MTALDAGHLLSGIIGLVFQIVMLPVGVDLHSIRVVAEGFHQTGVVDLSVPGLPLIGIFKERTGETSHLGEIFRPWTTTAQPIRVAVSTKGLVGEMVDETEEIAFPRESEILNGHQGVTLEVMARGVHPATRKLFKFPLFMLA